MIFAEECNAKREKESDTNHLKFKTMATDKDEIIIFMIEELTTLVKLNSKAPQIDLSKIDTLSDQLEQTETATRESITKIEEAAQQIKQPVKTERQEADTFRDNDLKYRYVKMKGEAPPQRLSELDEQNRLRQLEAEKLNDKVEYIKKKN